MLRTALDHGDASVHIISKVALDEFLEGKITTPTETIQVRAVQVREVVKRFRQVVESPNVSFEVPVSVYDRGYQAVLEWINAESDRSDKLHTDIVSEEQVGEDIIETETEPVIAVWKSDGRSGWNRVWGEITESINDTIRTILTTYGH